MELASCAWKTKRILTFAVTFDIETGLELKVIAHKTIRQVAYKAEVRYKITIVRIEIFDCQLWG